MKKIFILFCIMFTLCNRSFSQDYIECKGTISIKIDTSGTHYKILNWGFYLNDQSAKESWIWKTNVDSLKYQIASTYGCVSCRCLAQPDDIYIKVDIYNTVYGKRFSYFIPIYFEQFEKSSDLDSIGLITIRLTDFIDHYSREQNQIISPNYEIILVKKDGSVHKLKDGEYQLRKMGTLFQLKVKK